LLSNAAVLTVSQLAYFKLDPQWFMELCNFPGIPDTPSML